MELLSYDAVVFHQNYLSFQHATENIQTQGEAHNL